MYIKDLIKELLSYVKINSRNSTVSFESKSVNNVKERKQNELFKQSNAILKQSDMLKLFFGAIIFTMHQDEAKYGEDFGLKSIVTTVLEQKTYKGEEEILKAMNRIGDYTINHILTDSSFNFFTKGAVGIFFPDLRKNIDKVKALITFCIQYKDNLEQQVDIADLGFVPKTSLPKETQQEQSVDTPTFIESTPLEQKPQIETNVVTLETTSTNYCNLTMFTLGGIMSIAGVATIAIAFTALQATSVGLIPAIGIGLIIVGLGLICIAALRNCQMDQEVIDDMVYTSSYNY